MSRTYRYLCVAFRDGKEVLRQEKELTGQVLYLHTSQVGRTAFLELINRWNGTGLLGVPNGGPVYVYVAMLP